MDKLTATLVSLAIVCATGIAILGIFYPPNPSSKEIAILAITAIFSAISGGGVGYAIGKGGEDETGWEDTR